MSELFPDRTVHKASPAQAFKETMEILGIADRFTYESEEPSMSVLAVQSALELEKTREVYDMMKSGDLTGYVKENGAFIIRDDKKHVGMPIYFRQSEIRYHQKMRRIQER